MNALLSLWFALLGADRIDLFAGEGWFTLTPFLVLTPLIIVLEALRLGGRGGSFRVPPNLGAYGLLATGLLLVVLVSLFYSYDIEMSAKRYTLLAFQIYATLLMVVVIAQRPDPGAVLARGALWGIGIGTAFNAVQLVSYFQRGSEEFRILGGVVDMTCWSYGPWLPRLSAQAFDMNRGGILLLVYVFLLLRLAPPSRLRTLAVTAGVFGMVMSLSRSVLLGVLGTWMAIFLLERRFSLRRPTVLALSATGTLLTALLLVSPRAQEAAGSLMAPLASRFSIGEGSANVHFEVIAHGVEIATESPRNALIGVGYGNAFAYLQDYFPDDDHGNFHSLYLTFLVESGAVSLLLVGVLLFYAALRGGEYRPLIVGLAFFNIFYQMGAEAIFWLTLVLGWTRLGDPTRARPGATDPVLSAPHARAQPQVAAAGALPLSRPAARSE